MSRGESFAWAGAAGHGADCSLRQCGTVALRGRAAAGSRCERLFPAIGEEFRDQLGDPSLRLACDTSPGVHDMLFPACDQAMYTARGLAGHPNCRDNFPRAACAAGISLPAVPDPVNLFQNSGPQPDGRLAIAPAASRIEIAAEDLD
jgi:hypothetical protein